LEEITTLPSAELRTTIAQHMAFVHISIGNANTQFRIQQRRNNYTTPTSFLELIKFYRALLNDKTSRIND
jgi:dynein heavy chain